MRVLFAVIFAVHRDTSGDAVKPFVDLAEERLRVESDAAADVPYRYLVCRVIRFRSDRSAHLEVAAQEVHERLGEALRVARPDARPERRRETDR